MTFQTSLLRAAAVSIALAGPVVAQDETINTVVAKVGDIEITVGHVLDVKRQLPPQYQTIPDDVLFSGVVDQMVQQTLLSEALGEEPVWMDMAVENQRRAIASSIVIDSVRATAVTEETLRAAYQASYVQGETEQEFRASHILVETEELALSLTEQARDGADFAELAKEHSTGPSGPRGGDLGWFGKGMMVPPFEAAVVGMEAGGISGPVQTNFGWHVIQLVETRAIMPPSFEEVREELEVELERAAVEAKVAELMADVEIERMDISPTVLSTVTLEN